LGSVAGVEAIDRVGGAEADAGSEGDASLVLAATSSALVRAATSAQLIVAFSEGGIARRRLLSL
jgi:hypothetical protein